MSACTGRVVLVALASMLLLAGCETSTKLGDLLQSKSSDPRPPARLPPPATAGDPASTGTIGTEGLPPVNSAGRLGSDPNDDLNQGKKQFRANNFGIAERYFRRAVETHPRDAEAWVGLAASYDRLRRFDLADRAYRGGDRHNRRDPGSAQQSGLFLHAARRLCPRPQHAAGGPGQGRQ